MGNANSNEGDTEYSPMKKQESHSLLTPKRARSSHSPTLHHTMDGEREGAEHKRRTSTSPCIPSPGISAEKLRHHLRHRGLVVAEDDIHEVLAKHSTVMEALTYLMENGKTRKSALRQRGRSETRRVIGARPPNFMSPPAPVPAQKRGRSLDAAVDAAGKESMQNKAIGPASRSLCPRGGVTVPTATLVDGFPRPMKRQAKGEDRTMLIVGTVTTTSSEGFPAGPGAHPAKESSAVSSSLTVSDVIADQPRPVQACALRPMQLESPPRKVSATTAERVIKSSPPEPAPSIPAAVRSFPKLDRVIDMAQLDERVAKGVSNWANLAIDAKHSIVRAIQHDLRLPPLRMKRLEHVERALSGLILAALDDIAKSPSSHNSVQLFAKAIRKVRISIHETWLEVGGKYAHLYSTEEGTNSTLACKADAHGAGGGGGWSADSGGNGGDTNGDSLSSSGGNGLAGSEKTIKSLSSACVGSDPQQQSATVVENCGDSGSGSGGGGGFLQGNQHATPSKALIRAAGANSPAKCPLSMSISVHPSRVLVQKPAMGTLELTPRSSKEADHVVFPQSAVQRLTSTASSEVAPSSGTVTPQRRLVHATEAAYRSSLDLCKEAIKKCLNARKEGEWLRKQSGTVAEKAALLADACSTEQKQHEHEVTRLDNERHLAAVKMENLMKDVIGAYLSPDDSKEEALRALVENLHSTKDSEVYNKLWRRQQAKEEHNISSGRFEEKSKDLVVLRRANNINALLIREFDCDLQEIIEGLAKRADERLHCCQSKLKSTAMEAISKTGLAINHHITRRNTAASKKEKGIQERESELSMFGEDLLASSALTKAQIDQLEYFILESTNKLSLMKSQAEAFCAKLKTNLSEIDFEDVCRAAKAQFASNYSPLVAAEVGRTNPDNLEQCPEVLGVPVNDSETCALM